jgi:hypothetical protein
VGTSTLRGGDRSWEKMVGNFDTSLNNDARNLGLQFESYSNPVSFKEDPSQNQRDFTDHLLDFKRKGVEITFVVMVHDSCYPYVKKCADSNG